RHRLTQPRHRWLATRYSRAGNFDPTVCPVRCRSQGKSVSLRYGLFVSSKLVRNWARFNCETPFSLRRTGICCVERQCSFGRALGSLNPTSVIESVGEHAV